MKIRPNWPTKKLGEVLLLMFLGVVLIFLFVYLFLFSPDRDFWENAVSNLLATVLALIAGIPIALWIDRRIKQQEDREKFRLERLKEKEILTLIKEELSFSYSLFLQGKKGNTTNMTIQSLKSDLWDALVASGDIKYIELPELLNGLTSVYYIVKMVKEIEKQAYIAYRTSALIFINVDGKQQNAAQLILQDARLLDEAFEKSIKIVLEMINSRLEALKIYEK